jgi:hypothetical protein
MFKTRKIHKRSLFMHPVVSLILIDMYWHCMAKNMPFVVTDTVSTMEEDSKISRRHDTHRTGRAFDISVKGWGKKFRREFCEKYNKKYHNEAAYSSSSNRKTLCVDHVGTAPHIHVQVNRSFVVENLQLPESLI